MRPILTLLTGILLLFPLTATPCGGCFVPPNQSNTPVLQNAERILFTHDDVTKKSQVWIEIRYDGPPGDFSWVLPLPKVPTVTVGDSWLFDRLDFATAASFQLNFDAAENCSFSSSSSSGIGCASGNATGASAEFAPNSLGTDGGTDGVTILKHVQAGNYVGEVVQATDKTEGAAKMLKWLNDHKYAVPEKAKAILDDHVARGDVFLAIRLQAGATIKEIRPIALEMDDAEPCVPLRLTSIAAQDDMNVVVTVAGAGRAIPKNHLHVVVNPARLDWFGKAANYNQVLAAAMDEAAGRAFATEFAGKLPESLNVTGTFGSTTKEPTIDLTALNTESLATLSERQRIWQRVVAQKLPLTEATAEVLEKYLQQAKGADPAEFYQNLAKTDGAIIDPLFHVDGKALAAELEQNFCKPVREMALRVSGAPKVTRLVMRISPAEMTKDPVFAFNPSLPDVGNVTTATAHAVCRRGNFSVDAERLSIPALAASWVYDAPNGATTGLKTAADARFADAPAALRIEVLDETGEPFLVKPDDIAKVDLALANAHAGKPSLDLKLDPAPTRWTPPPSDALFNSAPSSSSSGNACTQGHTPVAPAGLLLLVAGLVLLKRRARE